MSFYSDTVLADTPFAYWRKGESSGTTMNDSSGNARNGTYGSIPTLGVAGALTSDPADTAVGYDGTADFASAALNLSAQTIVTVEFWLKWTTFANNDDLAMEFTPDHNANPGAFIIDPNSNSSAHAGRFECAMLDPGVVDNARSVPRPSAGIWHHYVIVYTRQLATVDAVKIYVDSVEGGGGYQNDSTPSSIPGNFANSTLYFMCRGGVSLFGEGAMDEVAIYTGELSAARVLAHYDAAFYQPLRVTRHPLRIGV